MATKATRRREQEEPEHQEIAGDHVQLRVFRYDPEGDGKREPRFDDFPVPFEQRMTVLDALDEHDIPHEWVLGVDSEKLDVVLAVTDLSEEEVYDADKQVYAQKTGVDEEEKVSRLHGLRLDESERGEGLHADLDDRDETVRSSGRVETAKRDRRRGRCYVP